MATPQSYDDVDMQYISFKTQDLMRDMGARDANDVVAKVGTLDDQAQYVESTTMTQDDQDMRYLHDVAFQRNTDLLAQMNESLNANLAISSTIQGEEARIRALDSQSRKDLYRSHQGHMQAEYLRNYYRFATAVLIATLTMLLLLLIPVALVRLGRLPVGAALFLAAVLMLLFALGMLFYFVRAAKRRTSDWSKFYWKVQKNMLSGDGNCNA